jgi:RNA polymerase sigma-70 factor (ECF subfamily)
MARLNRDRRLVKRLLRGEEAAFDELLDDHVPRLYRIALSRLGGDASIAEDVVQSTLARALPRLDTFRGEASLLTWLTTFCLHEIGDHFRRAGRAPRLSLSDEVPEIAAALEVLEHEGTGPESDTLAGEIRTLVLATLDRLPPRYAEALRWKYLEGLSMKEIATRWQTEPTAVQSVLQRARASFRDAFRTVGDLAVLDSWRT